MKWWNEKLARTSRECPSDNSSLFSLSFWIRYIKENPTTLWSAPFNSFWGLILYHTPYPSVVSSLLSIFPQTNTSLSLSLSHHISSPWLLFLWTHHLQEVLLYKAKTTNSSMFLLIIRTTAPPYSTFLIQDKPYKLLEITIRYIIR